MKRLLGFAVAAAAATLSTTAFAQNMFAMSSPPLWGGPEIGVQGGYGWGTTRGALNTAPPTDYAFAHTDGGLGGVHAGFNFQHGPWVLGIEGDAEGGELSGKSAINPGGVEVHTKMDFDASLRGKVGLAFNRFLAYGTGGVAFGDVKTHYDNGIDVTHDDIRMGYTAGGGIAYALTPHWETNAEYRYTDLGRKNIDLGGGVTDSNRFAYNVVRVGLTYRFAPPMAPPPPPAAAPMPAAAPAAVPMAPQRTFIVFFDFDRYNLTPDARRVVEAAAASYKATGSARIEVAGYTDLSGTAAYNLRLSQRRADTVAHTLARDGVPKNVMDVKWFGKQNPRVPTPDGVREPQNRRVEIMMP